MQLREFLPREYFSITKQIMGAKRLIVFAASHLSSRNFCLSKISLIFQEYLNTRYETQLHMMSSRISCKDKNFLQSQEILVFPRFSCLFKIFLSFQDFLVFSRFSCLSKIFLTFFPRFSWFSKNILTPDVKLPKCERLRIEKKSKSLISGFGRQKAASISKAR